VRCDCGCGYEGEDEVVQWLVEEACYEAVDQAAHRAKQSEAAEQDAFRQAREALERG
jgi:hypothetical protein